MHNFFSFSPEDSRELAEAFTDIADVIEAAITRADSAEFVHDVAAPERVLRPIPMAPLSVRKSYYRDHIETMAARNPGLSRGEIKKFVAARWKALSKEERAPFKDRYKALKRQFQIDVAAFDTRAKAYAEAGHGGPVSAVCPSEPSVLSKSPSPPPQPTEPQPLTSTPLSPLPPPAVRFIESDLSRLVLSPGPPRQLTECLNEGGVPYATEEIVKRELGPRPRPPQHPNELFLQSVRGAIREEFPGISWTDLRRLANTRWKVLSMEERQPFNDRRDALMKQYKIDVAAYDSRKEEFLSTYSEPVLTQSDEELERELGPKPVRPKNSKDLYYLENIQRRLRESPGLSVADARKSLSFWWRHASKEELQPHYARFQASVKQYDADIKAYYDRTRALVRAAYGMSESPNSNDVLEDRLGCKPKQPLDVSSQYYLDTIWDVVKDNPGLGYNDVRKFVTAQRKTVSQEVHKAYKDRYHSSMKQFKIDIAAYDARERALLKAAIRKLRQPCESSVANTAQSAQGPITDVLMSSVPPLPSQYPLPPMSTTGLLPWLSTPSLPTSSVPFGSAGPLPSLPLSIESTSSLWPVGPPASSLPALPSGASSSDVAAPAHPPAITWPAELTLPSECLASSSLSGESGGLPWPSTFTENTLSSIPATAPELATMATASAAATLAELVGSPETIAMVVPQEQPLSSNPPAPAVMSPAFTLPVESVEPQALFKPKKKKRKHAADGDTQEPSADHRKKKKHVSNVVVKIESGTGEATTNKENCQADNTDVVVKTEL